MYTQKSCKYITPFLFVPFVAIFLFVMNGTLFYFGKFKVGLATPLISLWIVVVGCRLPMPLFRNYFSK